MNKRKAVYALVGGLLVAGLVFNAPTMAAYKQDLGTATQTINAATWEVEFGDNLGEHIIFPGDSVSNDTIILTNNNSYEVRCTITLNNEGNSAFNDALSLNVTDGINSYTNKSGEGEVILGANETLTLKSNVKWNATGNDIVHAGKQVKYNYNVVAERVSPETPAVTVLEARAHAGYAHIRFNLTKELNLSAGLFSKDNVIVEFIKDGQTIETKAAHYRGYLNDEQRNKYPKLYGAAEDSKGTKYFDVLSPGIYSTSLTCDENDTPTHIRLTVKDDNQTIFEDTFKCN